MLYAYIAIAVVVLYFVLGGLSLNQNEFLNSYRVTGIMQGLQDPRLMQQPLVWNQRIPDVSAVDDEIVGYWQGNPKIADLIADDAKAVIYSLGRFSFETTKIPNLKMGIAINQAQINLLDRLRQNRVSGSDMDMLTGMQNRHIAMVVYGVELRKEALKLAMLMDGYSYDRLGIRLTGVTWGMPSDLKVVPSIAWSSTSATPLTDIQTVRRIARVRYGVTLNRITMSTAALQAMSATTEFINQSKLLGWGLYSATPSATIPLQMDGVIVEMLRRLLSGGDPQGGAVSIEIDDRRYWTQDTAGAETSNAFQPINVVLLTSTANDGNGMAYDFANGVVSEGMVSQLAKGAGAGPGIAGNVPAIPGPVGYVTLADPSLNPPGMVTWGVARGMPRKYIKPASATLTVGTLADPITVGVPFPI